MDINKAVSHQEGGDYYREMKIQPVDFIYDNIIGYIEGNIIKYLCRWRNKNGVEDLLKAKHYLEILIEKEQDNADIPRSPYSTDRLYKESDKPIQKAFPPE